MAFPKAGLKPTVPPMGAPDGDADDMPSPSPAGKKPNFLAKISKPPSAKRGGGKRFGGGRGSKR